MSEKNTASRLRANHQMVPNVFLSSTCYDLKQIRDNIADFVISQGFGIRNSTDPTAFFPMPGQHSYDSCTGEVEKCDLFVLIIGGRYGGTIPASGRSITNEEYLSAFSRHIPIFTFVHQTVWELLPVWKNQPDANFTPHVADNRVFTFIDEIRRQTRDNWIWPFATAGDIIQTLRHQWASYFAHLIRITNHAEYVRLTASRQSLMADYIKILESTTHSFDIIGASLVTVARSPGIADCLGRLASRGIVGRILVLDPNSKGARGRADEEYGESNLLDELRSTRPLWRRLTETLNSLSVRSYKQHPKYFIFRSDGRFFVSCYPFGDSSVNAPTLQFSSTALAIALFFQAQFDLIWESASNV